MSDLFSHQRPAINEVYPDTFLLAGFVDTAPLEKQIALLLKQSPCRKMQTPSGHYTNVALSNCGKLGWVASKSGYRYTNTDPLSDKPWPAMPESFSLLAQRAALCAGFESFIPDACLINHYQIGDKLGSHQDKDESDYSAPIVSVSIGLSAVFQVFGQTRSGVEANLALHDGDVMVWGRGSRLIYHGVKTLKADPLRPNLNSRFNLTFRCARSH